MQMHLINEKTGRIFVATPALMRRGNLRTATSDEVKSYFDEESDEKEVVDNSPKMGATELPADFDLDIDISTMSRPELVAVGAKVPGFMVNSRTSVGDVRKVLAQCIKKLKETLDDEHDEDEMPL
ncbi:MAG: hypothetical protein JKY67_08515 [Pseudomonadales bacterium]|nr:hypothetical protein [Pseudomonadales bacterium]